jgi:hypothetical protein
MTAAEGQIFSEFADRAIDKTADGLYYIIVNNHEQVKITMDNSWRLV